MDVANSATSDRETDAGDSEGVERCRRVTLAGLADVNTARPIDDAAMRAWADRRGDDVSP
jgi:hypothetical protein